MIIRSDHPDIDIPKVETPQDHLELFANLYDKVDILSYLFPENRPVSKDPVWIDAANPKKSLSPFELLQWIRRLGLGLDRLGVKRGEIVLIYTPNHIFVPVAYLGIVGNTRAFSAVNPIYTVNEIVHQLKNSDAKCLLVHPAMVKNAIAAAAKAGLPKDRIYQFNDEFCEPVEGVYDWSKMLAGAEEAKNYQWKKLKGEESVNTLATVNYSSGTTGLPKGVSVSHHNLISNVEQTLAVKWPEINPDRGDRCDERWIGFLPLYHAYGQLYANLLATRMTVPIYIMKAFVYTDFLQHVQDYKVNKLQVAPPILIMMTKRPETAKYDLTSLREIMCGAAPLSRELQNQVSKNFNVKVVQGWGMTEVTCGSILQTEPDDRGTVGKLIPNHECKLIDDEGKEVGYDTPGEMFIRSPNVCMGYFKNEAATRDCLSKDGWLQTGDVAVVNKEGYFWIVDRKKELIKVNALQVAPAELEALLLENEDVDDAAVTGITLFNEEWPRAYVQLRDSSKDKISGKHIQDWVAERVAKHKRLVGGVMFVDEVPKLASGKIQRKVMREWAKRDVPAMEKELGPNMRSKL